MNAFVACLSHLTIGHVTIGHASLSRRSARGRREGSVRIGWTSGAGSCLLTPMMFRVRVRSTAKQKTIRSVRRLRPPSNIRPADK